VFVVNDPKKEADLKRKGRSSVITYELAQKELARNVVPSIEDGR